MDSHKLLEYPGTNWMNIYGGYPDPVREALANYRSGDELLVLDLSTFPEGMIEVRERSASIMPPREPQSREVRSTRTSHAQLVAEVVRCHQRLRSLENRLNTIAGMQSELVTTVNARRRTLHETHRNLEPAMERIGELASLDDDWDGEEAVKPTSRAIATAYQLIFCVTAPAFRPSRPALSPSTSAPISDGGIQVEWDGDQDRIEVQVNPDGSLGYLIIRRVGEALEYEESDHAMLGDVVALIHEIVGEGAGSVRG